MTALLFVPSYAQTKDDGGLQKQIDDLKAQLAALRSEMEQLKTTLRDQSARSRPVFDTSEYQSMGDQNAKLVLIEFSDFECPYCREYFKTSYRQLIDAYVKTNKIRYVYGDFPGEKIHPHALKAAEAARCAGEQNKFWEMHDQLFERQRELGSTALDDGAKEIGLNVPQFDTCVASGKYEAKVRASWQQIAGLGIQGTPAFAIGTIPDPANPAKVQLLRAIVGAQPYTQFQQTIDGLLPK